MKTRKLKDSQLDRRMAHKVLDMKSRGLTFVVSLPNDFVELCQYFAQERKKEREKRKENLQKLL